MQFFLIINFIAVKAYIFSARIRARCPTSTCILLPLSSVATSRYQDQQLRKENILLQVANLLDPTSSGQVYGERKQLHLQSARRPLTDTHMWTHVFFGATIVLAGFYHFYEMIILLSITTPLSLIYHYEYEKPGLLANVEGVFAKLLFLYGALHLFVAPSLSVLVIELLLLLNTVFIFVVTNIRKDAYDPWHSLMHVIPPIWAALIVVTHRPLLHI